MLIFFSVSCSHYDCEITKVKTQSDSLGNNGVCNLFIDYKVKYRYGISIKESYVKIRDIISPYSDDSIFVLEYPCVEYKGDTLRGTHVLGNVFKEPTENVHVHNGIEKNKLIISSNYVSDLYQKKYHCKFENETKMMVDISKNGSFIIKRGRKTKKLKMNNELQFVEYGDIQF